MFETNPAPIKKKKIRSRKNSKENVKLSKNIQVEKVEENEPKISEDILVKEDQKSIDEEDKIQAVDKDVTHPLQIYGFNCKRTF